MNTFAVGDTVKDKVFGEMYYVLGQVTWYGQDAIEVLPWFSNPYSPQSVTFLKEDLIHYVCPPQPNIGGCPHERRSFIGLVSGRWACASCGEWLE